MWWVGMDKVVAALIECAKQGRGLVAKNLKLSMMHLVSAIPGPTANEGVEGWKVMVGYLVCTCEAR